MKTAPPPVAPPPPITATLLAGTGLPTTIPTYDTPPPTKPIPVEKEQAMAAAQMVTTKLAEMQAAKEAERQQKREARMAERMALMSGEAQKVEEQQGGKKVAAAVAGRGEPGSEGLV